jgi:hypothetical protein
VAGSGGRRKSAEDMGGMDAFRPIAERGSKRLRLRQVIRPPVLRQGQKVQEGAR